MFICNGATVRVFAILSCFLIFFQLVFFCFYEIIDLKLNENYLDIQLPFSNDLQKALVFLWRDAEDSFYFLPSSRFFQKPVGKELICLSYNPVCDFLTSSFEIFCMIRHPKFIQFIGSSPNPVSRVRSFVHLVSLEYKVKSFSWY